MLLAQLISSERGSLKSLNSLSGINLKRSSAKHSPGINLSPPPTPRPHLQPPSILI